MFLFYLFKPLGFFRKAKCVGNLLNESTFYNHNVIITGGDRADYLNRLDSLKDVRLFLIVYNSFKILIFKKGVIGVGVDKHRTSPFVRYGCGKEKEFIGGANEFVAFAKKVCILLLNIFNMIFNIFIEPTRIEYFFLLNFLFFFSYLIEY